jgi:hypothetical protein
MARSKPPKSDSSLARFLRRNPDPKELLGYKVEWRDACHAGRFVNEWHKTSTSETVTRRRFANARDAEKYFRTLTAGLKRDGYEARPATYVGWTIDPRGRRGYYNGAVGAWGSSQPWSRDVSIKTVTGTATPAHRAAAAAAPARTRKPNATAIAKLVRGFRVPPPTASYAKIIDATNRWFAAVVDAGLDLEPFAGADRDPRAIVTSGPYTAGAIREAQDRLAAPPPRNLTPRGPYTSWKPALPRSYVELLREHGDLAILADFRGRTCTFPLATRAGWPMKGTLDHHLHVLAWEVDTHGQPGSFTPAQLARRRWLRFAANAPGGSDHFFIMDLGELDRSGEPLIYRVGDIALPTAIDTAATVRGVRRWLIDRVHQLRAAVAATLTPKARTKK